MDERSTKTVGEIMRQRTWSGSDAGLLYLHSAANDITDSLSGTRTRLPFTQKTFERIVKSLVERPAEYQTFCVYAEIRNLVMDVAKEDQTFKQQFYHFLYALLPRFQEMARAEKLSRLLARLPEAERAEAEATVLSAENLLSDGFQKVRAEMEPAGECMEEALTYFGISNAVMKKVFEAFGTDSFMNQVLFDTEEFRASIEELNRAFGEVEEAAGGRTGGRLRRIYTPLGSPESYGREAEGFEFKPDADAGTTIQMISGLKAEMTRMCEEEARKRRRSR